MGSPRQLRVRFQDDHEALVDVTDSSVFEDVAQQVRRARGWDDHQNVRFISGGQEMYMQDSVSRATTPVVHCIATNATQRYTSAKQTEFSTAGQQQQPVDWLEVVDPGTVLMWIFGSILGLLWLLFVSYAHMFDRTSVVMLCMMTIAFLVPCVLSYIPCLRVLNVASLNTTSMQQAQRAHLHQQPILQGSLQSQYGSAAYSTAVPPRPSARVHGPGQADS